MIGIGCAAVSHDMFGDLTTIALSRPMVTPRGATFLDRFWNTFSTKGAEKRKQHGCKGAHVFRDPNESDRVWAIFDWDEAGWQSFTSDPEVPAIFQEAGFTQGPPKSAEFLREHEA
jgi:quinol monooxygenase YgiN